MHPGTIIGVLLITAVTNGDLNVTQNPGTIEVTEGMEFHLPCTFTTLKILLRSAYTWYKQGSGCNKCAVKNTSGEFIGRVLEQDKDSFEANKNASITIMDAKQNDTGIYYCEVSLFLDEMATGMGTRVTVKGAEYINADHPTSTPKNNLITLSMVFIVVLLQLTAGVIALHVCKHRDRAPRTRMEKQGVTTNGIVYADLCIEKTKTSRPEDHSEHQLVCPSVKAFEQIGDPIIYASVKPPNEIEEADVYVMMHSPEHNDDSSVESSECVYEFMCPLELTEE